MKTPEFKRQDDIKDRVAQGEHRKKLIGLFPGLEKNASDQQILKRVAEDERKSLEFERKMQKNLDTLKEAAQKGKAQISGKRTAEELQEEEEGEKI